MKILTITFDLSLIDQYTLVITIAGYCIVLLALAIMAYFFTRLHTLQDFLTKRRLAVQNNASKEESPKVVMTGEENAAIAAALYLFFSELHDEEKYVMTIRKVSKTYSPWNSKIYGIWNTMKHW
ncbi:MAG: OadG family protein [Bacteroidetes bacterium]|nr:OadG family protein [Bacteroidota bacterium]